MRSSHWVLFPTLLVFWQCRQDATSFSVVTRIGRFQGQGLSLIYSTYRPEDDSRVGRKSRKTTSFARTSTDKTLTSSPASDGKSITTTENSLILNGLNPSQVEAVTQPLKAVTRVIAGPGSGKTRVLTCRVAHLLNQDPRGQVLAVTFTKKAAQEMRHRVETLLLQQQELREKPDGSHGGKSNNLRVVVPKQGGQSPAGLTRVTVGTFHAICMRILRFNGDILESLPSVTEDMIGFTGAAVVDLDASFSIAHPQEQRRVLKGCIRQFGDEKSFDMKKVLAGINQIKQAKAQGIDPFAKYNNLTTLEPMPKDLRCAKEVYSSYRQNLLSNNTLDFDDLILMTREALLLYPNMRKRLHRRWPHVLVDEFQDTNVVQIDLVKLLTSTSLFVVGDADQSIYGWRGAHTSSLSDVKSEFAEFTENGVHTVYLKENYRYVPEIGQHCFRRVSRLSSHGVRHNVQIDFDYRERSRDSDFRRPVKFHQ